MAPPATVIQWLNNYFPKPRVDLEWLDGCCEWLIDDQNLSPITALPQFVERVREQLLESDLSDSMSKGTGFNPNITHATTDLQGPPILVQIIAMTEIGTSAFQLEQTRIAREERMRCGLGNIEGEEDGDVEVEGEGPMPKYPRGTLRFQLSDGETIIDAMEFRNLPQLSLGITELGYKMQLKGTKIQNGMALLEPATVDLLGGRQADLEATQLNDFKQGLRARLGRPVSSEPAEQLQPPAAVSAVRSPLREISPPLAPQFGEHEDDVDMEPRRRLPATSSFNDPPIASTSANSHQNRPVIGLPSRLTRTSLASNATDDEGLELERAPVKRNVAIKSAYFDTNAASKNASSSKQAQDLDFTFAPTIRQSARTLPSPSPELSLDNERPKASDASFDFDFLDELGGDENLPLPRVDKGKGPELPKQSPASLSRNDGPTTQTADGDPSSDDYGMDDIDFVDADFWDNVDKVIEKAVADGDVSMAAALPPSSASGSGSGTSSSYVVLDNKPPAAKSKRAASSSTPIPPAPTRILDVIEIDDSDEDMYEAQDKENQPVPTRHIRQRMDDESREGRMSGMPALSQKTGRPVVLARKPEDVIDLSDSE